MSKHKPISEQIEQPAPVIDLAVPAVPSADDTAAALDADQVPAPAAPAEQPPELLLLVQRTIGHGPRTWEPGEVVPASVFEAIPGCDVEHLIAKGALAFAE